MCLELLLVDTNALKMGNVGSHLSLWLLLQWAMCYCMCVYVLQEKAGERILLIKESRLKSSPWQFQLWQLFREYEEGFQSCGLSIPHIQQWKLSFVFPPSCWCSWGWHCLPQHFFLLKDRRLPCDPSLFLSNDTQPGVWWLIYWHQTSKNKTRQKMNVHIS